jgi:hypothetical protein
MLAYKVGMIQVEIERHRSFAHTREYLFRIRHNGGVILDGNCESDHSLVIEEAVQTLVESIRTQIEDLIKHPLPLRERPVLIQSFSKKVDGETGIIEISTKTLDETPVRFFIVDGMELFTIDGKQDIGANMYRHKGYIGLLQHMHTIASTMMKQAG